MDINRSILTIFLSVLLGACGAPTSAPGASGDTGGGPRPASPGTAAPGGPGTADPESPISSTPAPGGGVTPSPSPVEPRPGQEDVRPIRWDKAVPQGGGRVAVRYWSGVEPCHVLDHVTVRYRKKTVAITLFEGHAKGSGDVACIEIAEHKLVEVRLEEPLEGRKIVDGARRG